MSKKRLLYLIPGIILLIALLYIVFWFAGDSDRRAAQSRAGLQYRYTSLSLPGLQGGEMAASHGCNGLDFNDCETYSYTATGDVSSWAAELQKALTNQGFTIYPDTPDEFQAFNNNTAMYIQIERAGNQVTITVGEASNGRYAPH